MFKKIVVEQKLYYTAAEFKLMTCNFVAIASTNFPRLLSYNLRGNNMKLYLITCISLKKVTIYRCSIVPQRCFGKI